MVQSARPGKSRQVLVLFLLLCPIDLLSLWRVPTRTEASLEIRRRLFACRPLEKHRLLITQPLIQQSQSERAEIYEYSSERTFSYWGSPEGFCLSVGCGVPILIFS